MFTQQFDLAKYQSGGLHIGCNIFMYCLLLPYVFVFREQLVSIIIII